MVIDIPSNRSWLYLDVQRSAIREFRSKRIFHAGDVRRHHDRLDGLLLPARIGSQGRCLGLGPFYFGRFLVPLS